MTIKIDSLFVEEQGRNANIRSVNRIVVSWDTNTSEEFAKQKAEEHGLFWDEPVPDDEQPE